MSTDSRREQGKTHLSPVQRAGALGLATVFALGGVSAAASPAYAASVRPGEGWGQVDVMLDGVETRRAASSAWGSSVVCSSVAAAGATGGSAAGKLLVGRTLVGGAVGAVAGGLSCVGILSACSAQAYHSGRWAGVTVSPGGFWCWTY